MTSAAAPALRTNPLLSPAALLLAAIALSIGWGIRGNYGHETGAMLPGALAAIAVCLLSGRPDWQERVPYFACLGALGWGCGGSMSYMQVLSYTFSGHQASQYFGFWGLFLIGFLWACIGVAGTALPAVLSRKSLQDLFKPLTMLFVVWTILYYVERPLIQLVQTQLAAHFTEVRALANVTQRHELALYWFDSDWIAAGVFLVALLSYDLVDRKFEKSLWLVVFAAAGAVAGWIVQKGMAGAGWTGGLEHTLVRYYGDTAMYSVTELDSNWPQAFLLLTRYAGIAVGAIFGTAIYFHQFGKFRNGSGLFLSMAVGWFAGFLLLPVCFDLRMTPPRGDNWAGILGTVVGALIYLVRHNLRSVATVAIIGGTIGGIGYSSIACVEGLLHSRGNKYIAGVPGLADAWSEWQETAVFQDPQRFADLLKDPEFVASYARFEHWRSANWHSFLEQSYGFVNGLAVILAMALLVRRTTVDSDRAPRLHWPEILAITVALPALLYLNMWKNVADWTGGTTPALQAVMKAPLIEFSLTALGWFNLIYGFAAASFIALMSIHTRRNIAIVPPSWLGRGQLLFFLILWSFAIGNFGKALAGFSEQRLLTEGVILVNSVIATLLILLVPRENTEPTMVAAAPASSLSLWGAIAFFAIAAAVIPPLEAFTLRSVYGDAYVGARGKNFRFGPKANWIHGPHIKGQPEKSTAY